MSSNGWILTSERLPLAVDATNGNVWGIWNGVRYMVNYNQVNDGYTAWRPIDQPPEFVPPPKYRDVKFPRDWESMPSKKEYSSATMGNLIAHTWRMSMGL